MTKKFFHITLLFALASYCVYAQKPRDYFSHLQPRHRAILKKWLANRTWLRPATEDDFTDKEGLAFLRREIGKNIHPYYSIGDFNNDGKKDFAVILIVKGKEEVALAVFNAPFKKAAPAYFERGFYKHGRMYIAYNYMAENRLFLGVVEGDYYCMTLIPKGRKYTYEDCER
jgi:hypothetical protein